MARREIKQTRAHETRARILVGAAESFAENGFSGATVSDIMTRSGVTKGALYFHFDTKEAVADAVLDEHIRTLRAAVDALEGPPAQRLIDLGNIACDGLADDPIFQATARLAVERETYGLGRPAAFAVWADTAKQVLDEIDAAGMLRPGLDTGVLSRMLSASLLGLHLSARAENPQARLHQEVENFWVVAGASFVTPTALADLTLRRPA